MHAKDVIRQSINTADMALTKYLDDLDDAAFRVRPVAGMNTIAWQVGHLISTERGIVEAVKPGSCPPLPEGFDDNHKMDMAKNDDPTKLLTKDEYLAHWKGLHGAILSVLDSLSDADLDAESPERMRSFCPTVGEVLNMMGGIHPLMHVGQFVAVRRQLDKPIAF